MKLQSALAAMLLCATALSAPGAYAQEVPPAPAAEAAPAPVAAGVGAAMVPPEGWAVVRQDDTLVFTAPEGDVDVVVVPVPSADGGEDAVTRAWAAYDPAFARTVEVAQKAPELDGWDEMFVVGYETSPAEQLVLQGVGLRKGDGWTVVLVRGAIATVAKRNAQLNQSLQSLRPADYAKENFAGKRANPLDAARIERIKQFVADSMERLKIPGAGLALIDDGKIVYEGGIGVKDAETGEPVDKDTLFMVASNTKGMATLLLSTLVDEGRLDWNQKVVELFPDFRLGSEETTDSVLVKHLVCACTGLPRKDMQWVFNTSPQTPASETFVQLAATEPTSGFGEVFQYNNLMASAAGYLGAHLVYPALELGSAFDRALDERIFTPLGMDSTTFDFATALAGNYAKPYDMDLDGNVAPVRMKWNYTVVPYRPAGGAWSSAHDMALYALDELREGVLPDGTRLVSAENLLERRNHNVPIGENAWYGMGLQVDETYGVSVISHGGSLFGYKSNWYIVPEAGAGAVLLTNSDSGQALLGPLQRFLLEVLYDASPKAEQNVAGFVEFSEQNRKIFDEQLDETFDPVVLAELASTYGNPDLGPLEIDRQTDGAVLMKVTSGTAELTTRKNEDGSVSVITIEPGLRGLGLLVAEREGKRALVLNDAQHEYVFLEAE